MARRLGIPPWELAALDSPDVTRWLVIEEHVMELEAAIAGGRQEG